MNDTKEINGTHTVTDTIADAQYEWALNLYEKLVFVNQQLDFVQITLLCTLQQNDPVIYLCRRSKTFVFLRDMN